MADELSNDQILEVVQRYYTDVSSVEDVFAAVAKSASAHTRRAWCLHSWGSKVYTLDCHCPDCKSIFPYPYMWLPGASTEETQVPTECPNCELGIELEVLGLLGA